jgi:alpha-tubulin suppressor-like RCC1 family protein
MKRLLLALFLSVCTACGAGLVDHNGVNLATLSCNDPAAVNCGGVCTLTDSDPSNCGVCGHSCPTPSLANKITCSQSNCGFTCEPGFFLCDGTAAEDHCCPASTIAAGADTSCAVVETKVRCWGSNIDGQLGTDPAGQWSAKPLPVPGLPAASSVAVGGHHACAIAAVTGEVWCWGSNSSGQLGVGPTTSSAAQKVTGITGAKSLALGAFHSCALTPAGLVCWGANNSGQLGDGTTAQRTTPSTPVALPSLPSSVSAGAAFTCAVASSSVYCWGSNDSGQLTGAPPTYTYSADPVKVANAQQALVVGTGASHACATGAGSKLWCWGSNSSGQIGNGSSPSSTPTFSGVSVAAVTVAGGLEHTCAIADDGTAYCWGSNVSGQLGTGSPTPVELRPAHVNPLIGVLRLALGATHTCAQTSDGVVSCWGNNSSFQLGNPQANLQQLSPLAIQQ